MAYKALYRTYRPNGFQDVAGQQHIVKTLQNAVQKNKIAHAYLFCGPRGTGKTSIAKIFAKAVNCTGEGNKPCLSCENCLAITEGSHPDIVEIDAASNNGVEEVRNLIEKVKYAPIKGKYKVYIIDEVHMMSTGAFNALLKTIEEPPAHVIFILATTEPHKVLPTIISRCQRYDFTKVPDTEIVLSIKKILEKESVSCSDEAVRLIAQLADGGMRDALSILDQCIAYAQNNIEAYHVNEIYGIATVEDKLSILESVFQKEAGNVLNKIEELTAKGTDLKRLTTDFINLLKETIIYDYTKDASLLKILSVDEVRRLKINQSTDSRLKMIDVLMQTFDKYRNAASVRSYFEVCLLKMMNISSVPATKKVIEEIRPVHIPTEKQIVSESVEMKQTENKTEDIKVEPQETDNVSRETSVPESIDTEDVLDDLTAPLPESELTMVMEMIHEEPTCAAPTTQITENKSANPLKDEFILQLLVGANKQEKKKVNDAFAHLDDYLYELSWAKHANLIKGSQNVASGEQYVVLAVENQARANEINENDKNNEFISFTRELFHQDKKIFAVTCEQSKRIIQLFKERMASNSLPEAIQFENVGKECVTEEKRELTPEESIINLFGEDHVTIVEE